ncbi:prolow-density lipoprotein receptor-related protein 1 [Galleria mellonella]|uniref:Prolow-density lipoprotein receptor-related protein 1 n=1 Tax=Galleria mellonella TaxID=7137 RepID=A0ABM3MYI6_GALME|nr:prolow-density lipoprotein receptor-related protein 1 [Galleria mellonella]
MTAIYVIMIACMLTCGVRAQFIDKMQLYEKECLGEDKFACLMGGCVLQSQYCDGNIDCPDATDEDFCPSHSPDPETCHKSHQFLCADGKKCIPHTWICNNYTDCDDGSDEVNCTDQLDVKDNSTCKGFTCDGNKCISKLWVCDGIYDCLDKTDEYTENNCRQSLISHLRYDGTCSQLNILKDNYRCIDSSYCLPAKLMCDGMVDCRDGSDEGAFCDKWNTSCADNPCKGNNTRCIPERYGPSCICNGSPYHLKYNYTTNTCEDVDECAAAIPLCSHTCHNLYGRFKCSCDEGYTEDRLGYLCFASGPEALLFYSTKNEIGFIKVRSKERVTLVTGIKEAHGVAYNGRYLFWVETAQGHQAIMRADLENVQETKEVIVGIGIEEPGDIAVDWLGGHIYFSDSERGMIAVCRTDGSICTILKTHTNNPRFVTLAVKYGQMYWADWHHRPVIMAARMDGSDTELLVDNLKGYATGLAVDVPNGRLYYVDNTIKAVKLDDKQTYSLLEGSYHHPYAIAVFERTVFWSEWTSQSIQTTDKLNGIAAKRENLATFDTPVHDMHIYHPVLMKQKTNPCRKHNCSHMCLLTSNVTYTCACPEGMRLKQNTCYNIEDYKPLYLIVGSGAIFTQVHYDSLGSAETHASHFNIGWVQAMAYDNSRDVLYVYDGQRKLLSYINMSDFSLGLTRPFYYNGLMNIIDMDYDYVSDSLYMLDAGRNIIEVMSLKKQDRVIMYILPQQETPLSFCVMPDYGKLLLAVRDNGDNVVHIDSMGLDGSGRKRVVTTDLRGPRITLRYAHYMDLVYIADDGNSVIDLMHPKGIGRERFRELSTSISSLALTDGYVFWADRRTPRLFWAPIHDVTTRTRRIQLSIFPNNTKLHILATTPPLRNDSLLSNHPCIVQKPCSNVCVQIPHPHPHTAPNDFHMGYKCLCPLSLFNRNGTCIKQATCKAYEIYCHKSNVCVSDAKYCDGEKDCAEGEDEEGCNEIPFQNPEISCPLGQIMCDRKCINQDQKCPSAVANTTSEPSVCGPTRFQCFYTTTTTIYNTICVERSQLCDGKVDCPNGSDEETSICDTLTCRENEFMCTSGSCILSSFKCDGEQDCADGSDEADCNKTCAFGYYQCRNKNCIEMRKRCDGQNDCSDHSDEELCEEPVTMFGETLVPRCEEREYSCELNRSICLPFTARCNFKTECPGGTDEIGCDLRCAPRGLFECKEELICLAVKQLCNGVKDCLDGSDEIPEVCSMVNRTSSFFPPPLYPADECRKGFLCKSGQCIELKQVCDRMPDCFDGSDEGGDCYSACNNHSCRFSCVSTPSGPRCICPNGYKMDIEGQTCVDIDECVKDTCSQRCENIPGSFLCSCYHGYALRSDRRSCKAVKGNMSILYVSGNTVRSISADGTSTIKYSEASDKIFDVDNNVRESTLYVTIPDAGKLVEIQKDNNKIKITNIGRPTMVAVDWITGNVYFVDKSTANTTNNHMRVCNFKNKRCAKLQKLPISGNAKMTSLKVDPASCRMFYCITNHYESVVWSASLAGQNVVDLSTVQNCTGLTVDSFRKRLYVAETGPSLITRMNFDGDRHKTVIFGHPQLQEPNGLALFEDSIYFLADNTSKLSRCQLFGKKQCEPFIYRMFEANTFVISHESVQRDDLKNSCEQFTCSNVCVLDKTGPLCVCYDGTLAKNGLCTKAERSMLPLFDNWVQEDYTSANKAVLAALTAAGVLFVIYLSMFIYYRYVYRAREIRASTYMEVRFQNTNPRSPSVSSQTTSTIEVPEPSTPSESTQEYMNPIQFVKDIWRQSVLRKPRKPIGTAGLNVQIPKTEKEHSDTESDLDD